MYKCCTTVQNVLIKQKKMFSKKIQFCFLSSSVNVCACAFKQAVCVETVEENLGRAPPP